MARIIISTVGTSLIGNAKKENNQDLVSFIRSMGEEKASAETNALKSLSEPGDEFIFLASDSDDGRNCAKSLESYFSSKKHKCEVIKLTGLTGNPNEFTNKGLIELIRLLGTLFHEKSKNHEVILNANGGYKSESAIAATVAQLFSIPTYYIHETFKSEIKVPSLPVGWDNEVIDMVGPILEEMSLETFTYEQLKDHFKNLGLDSYFSRTLPFFENVNDKWQLGALGFVVFDIAEREIQSSTDEVWLSKSAAKTLRNSNMKNVLIKNLNKLRNPRLRENLTERKRNSMPGMEVLYDCHALFCEKEPGKILICEIESDYQEYHRTMNNGQTYPENYDYEIELSKFE
jgi:putative CRISPR-associated protein (TIGR02619 family)